MSAPAATQTRLAPLAPLAPAVPHGIAEELAQVRDLERTGQTRFEQVTRGKGDYVSRSPLQHFDAWLVKRKVTEKAGRYGRPYIVTPSLAAGVVAGLACWYFKAGFVQAALVGSAVAAAGSSLIAAAKLARKEAAKERTRAAENLVPLDGTVAKMIDRFREAGPGEKAVLGQMLQSWLQQLSAAKALEPETRAALQRVDGDVKRLPAEHQVRAQRLSELGKIIDAADTVYSGTVNQIRSSIDAFPVGERYDLAVAVQDCLKSAGRVIEYQAKHDLYDLLERYAAAKAANT